MPALAASPHIWFDPQGRAWLDDTNTKVIEVILPHLAYGWSAELIQEHHSHLSLVQVYAALAYYYDHQEEFAHQIAEQARAVEHRRAAGESPLQQRLRQLRLAR